MNTAPLGWVESRDFAQVSKYIGHIRSSGAPCRAIILLTQRDESWPSGVSEVAGADVQLVSCRWQKLGDIIRQHGGVLALDFVHLLEQEGLVTPEPLIAADWTAWALGIEVQERLRTLLEELRPRIEKVAPNFQRTSWGSGTGWLFRTFTFERVHLGLGFSPTYAGMAYALGLREMAPTSVNADASALAYAYAVDPVLDESERRTAATAATASQEDLLASSLGHVVRAVPAAALFTSGDFRDQVGQAARFVVETGRLAQHAGYAVGVGIRGSPA